MVIPVMRETSRRIWLRLELLAETERLPSEYVTTARRAGSCNGDGGWVVTGVGGIAEAVVEDAGIAAGGRERETGGDCAVSTIESAKLAAVASRIGAVDCICVVGRSPVMEGHGREALW